MTRSDGLMERSHSTALRIHRRKRALVGVSR
jgi:hypothetical protein